MAESNIIKAGATGGSTVAIKDGSSQSGTLMTPQGAITWTRTSDGSITAEGGGQKLIANGQDESDGSWQKHAAYAQTGKAPYLTMESVGKVAEHKVEFMLTAGSSQLMLNIANIDALVTSGTATLSGTWNGVAVHWTGHVDLTSNPLVSRPIAGWPTNAFAAELKQAAFFGPLGNALAQKLSPVPVVAGGGKLVKEKSIKGALQDAGAWCVGASIVGVDLPGVTSVACACWQLGTIYAPSSVDDPHGDPPIDTEPIGTSGDTSDNGDEDLGGGAGGGGGVGPDGRPELEEK